MLQSYIKGFSETEREILLPVSVSIAQQRLNAALAIPKTIPGNILLADKKYSGSINGTDVFMDFTVYGRSVMSYSVRGQLLFHPNGSKLIMTVKDKDQSVISFAISLAILFLDYGIVTKICLMILFNLLYKVVIVWHRNSAVADISRQIYQIATTVNL